MLMTRKTYLRSLAAIAFAACTLGTSALAQSVQVLRIGLIPSEDAQAMISSSAAVMEQLSAKTGMEIKPFVANDYNGVIEALRSGKLDVAYLGPFSYVLANAVAGAQAFAIPIAKKSGTSSYRSLIITRKDQNLSTVAQLQGQSFAFVDPSSASGHLFPKAGLIADGIVADKHFGRVIFSGSHDASIMAVVHGKVKAAAVAEPILHTAVARGHVQMQDLQIVWTSQPIPESPLAASKHLSPQVRQQVATALAEIQGLPWGDRGLLNGFATTNDQAYDVVRQTAQALNLDLEKMK